MNLNFLRKIAKLGSLGYNPDVEISVVRMTTDAPDDKISHLRPKEVLVCESGTSYVDASIVHALEEDFHALISACGVKTDGRSLHECMSYAAERVSIMTLFHQENYKPEETE